MILIMLYGLYDVLSHVIYLFNFYKAWDLN